MAIEDDDDRDVFVDSDEFAAVVTTWNGAEVSISALFDRPVRAADVDGSTVEALEAFPSALVNGARLPAGAARGDRIVLVEDGGDGETRNYTIRNLRPDGTGMVRIDLEESA